MKRLLAALALVAVGVALVIGPSSADQPIERADHVLVISIPTLTWDRVHDEAPPALTELFARSAIASMSVRTIGIDTNLAEGYATIGSGNRAGIPRSVGGLAFPPDTEYEGDLVRDVYERRFGVPARDAEVLQIGAAAIQRRNDGYLYGTEVGSLGAALRAEGLRTGIVANGDLELNPPVEALHREAALAVMDDFGRVDRGRVDPGLLEEDPDAPTGVRLDLDVVAATTDEVLADADLVLVELSDMLRVESVENVVTPDVYETIQAEALVDTDRAVAALLELVDLERDLVIVVSPTAPRGPDQLVVTSLTGPGVATGLARSGTTRRDGYVTLPDVGPTILAALGVEKPSAMSGATMASSPDSVDADQLATDNTANLFRNRLAGPLTVIFIISQVLTYGLGAYALHTRRLGWCRAAAFLLLAGMAVPFVSFLAGVFPYWRLGLGGALLAVFGAAAGLAALVRLVVARVPALARRPLHERALLAPLTVGVATAVLLVVDIATGGPLQIDTAFGYGGGAIVAGRFAGYGNLAWAMLVVAVIISTTGMWGRWRLRTSEGSAPGDATTTPLESGASRFGLGLVGGVFVLTVLSVGLPSLGANVGGTLSVVAGLLITWLLLAEVRLDLKRLFYVGLSTVGVLSVFGAVDVTRDPEDQTHLGRLIEQTLGDEGLAGFGIVLQRKIQANLNILFSSVWSFVIPAALGFLAFLIWRPPRFLRELFASVPGMRACVIGALATGAIGGVVNDSGIAIPAIMLTLLVPHIAFVIVEAGIGDVLRGEPVLDDLVLGDAAVGNALAEQAGDW